MTSAEEADRLWFRASELRLIADYLEDQARQLRGGRQSLDHRRYFDMLAERDGIHCHYCGTPLHPFDPGHRKIDALADFLVIPGHDREPCWMCADIGNERCAHIDHRLPVSQGGTNAMENLVLACAECNLRKGATTEADYRRSDLLERSEKMGAICFDTVDLAPEVLDTIVVWRFLELVEGLLDETDRPKWVRQVGTLARQFHQARVAHFYDDDSEPF